MVLRLLPLGLLAFSSLAVADGAVRGEVRDRVDTTASVSRVMVDQQMGSLGELVDSYARRPELPGGCCEPDRRAAVTWPRSCRS